MQIDLTKLNYEKEIIIDEVVSYSKEYLQNSDILALDNVQVFGKISKDYENNLMIELNVSGNMILEDAITSLEVPYPFVVEIQENLENSLKTLDLIEFLWHYIVLEIPIRYTLSDTKELKRKYANIYEKRKFTK